jgi:hypothetical protein
MAQRALGAFFQPARWHASSVVVAAAQGFIVVVRLFQ